MFIVACLEYSIISYQKCKYNRIYLQKIFSFYFLKEMDYNKTKKPFLQQKGQKMRRKDNKMNRAQESEYQLPSSKKGNAKSNIFKATAFIHYFHSSQLNCFSLRNKK